MGSTTLYELIERSMPKRVINHSYNQDNDTGDITHLFDLSKLALEIHISSGSNPPIVSCQVYDLEGVVARRKLDPLRHEIRENLRNVLGGPSLARKFDIDIGILQALETIAEFEAQFEKDSNPQASQLSKGWSAGNISSWKEIVENPHGLDVSTVKDTAYELLGKTPEEIVKDIPDVWRVLHMESVVRPDLTQRFWDYKQSLRQSLESHTGRLNDRLSPHSPLEGRVRSTIPRRDIIEDMVAPRITFHGTRIKSVASIVRHGFKMPGSFIDNKVIASPRSGVVFDRGIYSSQAPFYAMSYAAGQQQMTPLGLLPSMRLFVCATIMGRTYRGQGVHSSRMEGYDSHFDGGFEYIIHDPSAMIPCYVIHLDLGTEAAKKAMLEVQRNPSQYLHNQAVSLRNHRGTEEASTAPGDIKRAKEARKAAAMKWFPYGFGSATGTNFVIEEIGAVSDDEEDYGDWQGDKHAYLRDDDLNEGEDNSYYDDWDEDGNRVRVKRGLFMDQYQGARR